MAIAILKKASKTPDSETDNARKVVSEMLTAIETGREQAVREYARKLDGWDGPIVLDEASIAAQTRDIPAGVKEDIATAASNVRRFAEAQRASIQDFAIELSPGLRLGQRLVPVNTAGCYVPTGRYAHIASACAGFAVCPPKALRSVFCSLFSICIPLAYYTRGGVRGMGRSGGHPHTPVRDFAPAPPEPEHLRLPF